MGEDTHLESIPGTAELVCCGILGLKSLRLDIGERGHGMCRSALIDVGDLVLLWVKREAVTVWLPAPNLG